MLKRIFTLAIALTAWIAAAAHAEAPTTPSDSTRPLLGVYTWGYPGIVKGYQDQFTDWLNQPIDLALDFQTLGVWEGIEGEVGQLRTWSNWVQSAPGRRLVLSVQKLPNGAKGPEAGSGKGIPVSLEDGANGTYNDHFRKLAENLVKFHLDESILRLGWEFNGGWYHYRAMNKEASFAEYWRQIVKTMRSVPGAEKLTFCWNPSNTLVQFDARKCWPGDEYVDYVGVDVYDQSWLADTYPIPGDASPEERQNRWEHAWAGWN